MSPSPAISPKFRRITGNGRSLSAVSLLIVLASLVLLGALTGCGGGGEKDTVLATVGDKEIKADYYEDRLSKLEEKELPRGDDGSPLDMSLIEGKEKFLETLINKEIMVQTAKDMGLQNDPAVVSAASSLTSYEASVLMWDRVIKEPSKTITPEELEAFHNKMGSSRHCLYVICNFEDDAKKAQAKAQAGTDWEDIITEFHDGSPAPGGKYEIDVPFGRYNPAFENGVFDTELGGITPPINTIYGFWVLKVLEEKPGKRYPLEEVKAQILDITYVRKMSHLKDEFRKGVNEKFQLKINEDALWKCYQALPAGETLFREGTQEPRSQDELAPLNIATEDMDMVFYSYLGRDGVKEFTLLDYKIHFDKMSVFQRPKDTDMLGGLRNKVQLELEKILLNFEAEDRGLFEDPEVAAKVDIKIEQMVVNKLYTEVVVIDEQVTPEDLDAFWAEHAEQYVRVENRSGRLVVCLNEEQAALASAKAAGGASWKEILIAYGTDQENKSKSGKIDKVIYQAENPLSGALFALEPGQVSEPFPMEGGRFGVVLLESVTPMQPAKLDEVRESIGQRIREIRKEEAFQAKMAEWKEAIPVEIFEDNLADLASWEELTAVEVPENLVPRN